MTSHSSSDALDAEIVVIGAGLVGLATAQRLARDGHSVLVVERHEGMARETSSHNSGVIHASIYYPTGSLKHRLCWEGNPRIYEWAAAHDVPVRATGKLIVALAEDERPGLDEVFRQAIANDVRGVERITGAQARELEPHIPVIEAIWSPSTGVVDNYALARSYEAEAIAHGALVVYHHAVTAIDRVPGGFTVGLRDADGERSTLRCAALVNSAGHGAAVVGALLGYPVDGGNRDGVEVPVMRQSANAGRYYDIVDPAVARLVSRPVYPLPDHQAGGLGLHLTVDTEGSVHLGPSTEWMTADTPMNYHNAEDAEWRARFLSAGRRFLPNLRDDQIAPGQMGYRPKIQRPDQGLVDFLIWHDRGYVHLGGIESPGLTSSLTLADEVAAALR